MPSGVSRPAAAELLAAFGRVMQRRRLRWYVFGAQAVVVYGRPRLTADVDVTVELVGSDVRALLADLQKRGFELRFPLRDERLAEARLLPMVHVPTAMPLDLMLAERGLEEEFLSRARACDIGGVKVPVISVEDLVAVKILAGRRKDLEDVRGVLVEQSGRIDLERTRDVLSSLEAALGEDKLLPRLDRLLRAALGEAEPRRRAAVRARTAPEGRKARRGKR
jgi:predicted nucleotidyltransferase